MPRMAALALIFCCFLLPGRALGQTRQRPLRESASAERPAKELTIDAIERRLKQVQAATNLDDAVRKDLISVYTSALEHLKAAQEHAEKADEFRKKSAEAPRELDRLRAWLESPQAESQPQIAPEMGIVDLQEKLVEAEQEYEALQKEVETLQAEPERRADRRLEIADLQQVVRKQIDEIENQAGGAPSATPLSDPAVAASRVLLAARRHALEHELQVYEEELRHYELTSELLEARRDHALVRAEHAERHLKIWRAAVNERRRRDADEQAQAAHEVAAAAPPAIHRLAEENDALSSQRQDLIERIEIADKAQDTLQEQLDVLGTLFKRVKERVKRVGLTESIGLLLRKQRDDIPNVAEHLRFIEDRKAQIAKLSLEVEELEDRREALADLDEAARRIVAQGRSGRRPPQQASEAEARIILEMMRRTLDGLIADMNSYIDKLIELDKQEAELVAKSREFSDFTREYILWIKSTELPRPADGPAFRKALAWVAAPRDWSAGAQAFVADARRHVAAYIAGLIALAALVCTQRFWRNILRTAGSDAVRQQGTSIAPTGLALLATVMLAAAWPLAFWLAGWRLRHLAGHAEFQIAVAKALEGAAFFLATVGLTRQLCRGRGLGEAHFGWPAGALQLVAKHASWLTLAGLPLASIVLMTESQGDEAIKNTLGRTAFVALQFLVLVIAHQVWHSPQGLARRARTPDADRWWVRFCRLAHLTSLAAPLGLGALAVVGYYYTAVQLAQRFLITGWLVGTVLVVQALLLRWLLLAYRDLAMQRGREQRAAELAARSATEHLPEGAVSEPIVRLSDINTQTHQLLGLAACCAFLIGFSVIWAEVLPAFEILDSVQLWPRPFAIVDPASLADSNQYALSLGELTIAVMIGLTTVAAARNVPGLVEITVLRHLKLDSGARYAVDALTRYVITVCGLSLAFGRVGVGWKDVQWLIAAVSVGLGFGLQEIFANFASGLLLLFERPIRIGDTVSIGDVTGKVTRIRIRATTIVDGDMRELIVPNREFISGKVMNWTLSDTVSRMTIKIGVPHGSDPDQVRELLLHVATSHPLVLKSPPPHALFDEFSGDKLNFTLHVYMGSREVYDQLRHELNVGINALLVQAGIEKSDHPDGPPHGLSQAA